MTIRRARVQTFAILLALAGLVRCSTGVTHTAAEVRLEVSPAVTYEAVIHDEHGTRTAVGSVIEFRTNGVTPGLYHYVSVYDPQTLALWELVSQWSDAATAIRDLTSRYLLVAGDGTVVSFSVDGDALSVRRALRHVAAPETADAQIITAKLRSRYKGARFSVDALLGAGFRANCSSSPSFAGGSGKERVWKATLENCHGQTREISLDEGLRSLEREAHP